jgi:DNA-directed RNA polymerase subunit RPC12/RpoP
MAFPIKVCAICSEEFELKPDKPGFANRCPECSITESDKERTTETDQFKGDREANQARRQAIRDLLYRKDG